MYTVQELAILCGAEIVGDPTRIIKAARPFEEAGEFDVTLAVEQRFTRQLEAVRAGCVIIALDLDPPQGAVCTLLRSKNPRLTFAQIRTALEARPFQPGGISPQASVSSRARIATRVTIHPFVRIGRGSVIEAEVTLHSGVVIGENCHIGAGSTLFPNVTLYPHSRLGERVILHAGSVIGADGFGYIFDGERHYKVPQSGSVEIGDEVEIGANSCVDRGTLGPTRLERGVKLDNQVHVGHNCHIGAHTVVVGCVGISGSVQIGEHCILAGQSGVSDHVRIGDKVTVMQKTAVTRDVASGAVISGMHGRDHREQLRIEALLRRLPEMVRDVRNIKKYLKKIENDFDSDE